MPCLLLFFHPCFNNQPFYLCFFVGSSCDLMFLCCSLAHKRVIS
uniref:Uncharacterized protein n=1 Tax=Rhizophora mucronata TaxID=61149 RepID=A0A2P2MZS4_RHIMU